MKVLILDTREQAVNRTVEIILETVEIKPDAVLGLATGGTMLPVYRQLVSLFNQGAISFSRVSTFNLDEYIGLQQSHPCSYRSYMQKELFDHIDVDLAHTYLPRGDHPDPQEEAASYERLISEHGGIDLQLLGIGNNGHIGFNEPTSSLSSRTRIKTLADSTRTANRRFFAHYEETPRFALTMGIGTILEAGHCLLLATGTEKCDAVARMIEGPLSAACPASALQLHPRATIVLDVNAASRLQLRDYYYHYRGPQERDKAMENIKKILEDVEANIEQLRDEIKLKAHLGKAEAKDELEKLEEKWKQLQEKYQPVADEIGTTAENAAVGLSAAVNELKEGFKRIKKIL